MSATSFILSSLLTLVALMDSNPMTATCINSSVVNKVTIEGSVSPERQGLDIFKEKWMGACGPLKSEIMDQLNLVQRWFALRQLENQPVEILVSQSGMFEVKARMITLPIQKTDDAGLLARLLTKSLFLQNGITEKGVGFETAADLVLTDVFGNAFVNAGWSLDGLGIFGEFANLERDCKKGLVPPELKNSECTPQAIRLSAGKISPWPFRWVALQVFTDLRSDHYVETRVSLSKSLFVTAKALSRDLSLSSDIENITQLGDIAKDLFFRLDPSLECYRKWSREFDQIQVLVSGEASEPLADPLPKNSLILAFDSGFKLVTGESLQLQEKEIFPRAKRVAFIDCKGPTVSDILQYSGNDKRLLFIESCDTQKRIHMDLFEKYGPAGIEHKNPKVRFIQFHQPSIKLALQWGLETSTGFGFGNDGEKTPEKFRRLFGWTQSASMKLLTAPIPVVEIFNAKKNETLNLRGM